MKHNISELSIEKISPYGFFTEDKKSKSETKSVSDIPENESFKYVSYFTQNTTPLILGESSLISPAVNLEKGRKLVYCDADRKYEGVGEAITGSTWQTNSAILKSKKATADLFQIHMRENGLPIAIIIDGCSCYAEHSAMKYLSHNLINWLVSLMTILEKNQVFDDLEKLVKKGYEDVNNQTKIKAEFDASVALVGLLQIKEEVLAIGISTGDTLVVLENKDRAETFLSARNVYRDDTIGPPLPFPSPECGDATLQNTLDQLEIAIQPVTRNHRFLLMTDGIYMELPLRKEEIHANERVTLIKTCLQEEGWLTGRTISEIACDIQHASATTFSTMSDKTQNFSYGDDATIGSMRVPTREQQKIWAQYVLTAQLTNLEMLIEADAPVTSYEIKNLLIYIKESDEKVREVYAALLTRVFWLIANIERGAELQKTIELRELIEKEFYVINSDDAWSNALLGRLEKYLQKLSELMEVTVGSHDERRNHCHCLLM